MGLRELNKEEKLVFNKPKSALLFYIPDHCAGCKMAIQVLNKLNTENWDIVLVDSKCDELNYLVTKYNISTAPTIVVFEDGKEVETIEGLKTFLAKQKMFGE